MIFHTQTGRCHYRHGELKNTYQEGTQNWNSCWVKCIECIGNIWILLFFEFWHEKFAFSGRQIFFLQMLLITEIFIILKACSLPLLIKFAAACAFFPYDNWVSFCLCLSKSANQGPHNEWDYTITIIRFLAICWHHWGETKQPSWCFIVIQNTFASLWWKQQIVRRKAPFWHCQKHSAQV